MENPQYTFTLSGTNFSDRVAFPVFGDSLSVDFDLESGQEFFRRKLNGKLQFIGGDYAAIMADPFDSRFTLEITDANGTEVFAGYFYKTDCEINEAKETITVQPSPNDDYAAIINGLDKEFNLTKLSPAIAQIDMSLRPIIQVYNKEASQITCISAGASWQIDCEPTDVPGDYYFAQLNGQSALRIFSVFGNNEWTGDPVPNCFPWYYNTTPYNRSSSRGGYYIRHWQTTQQPIGILHHFAIVRESDNQDLWQVTVLNQNYGYPFELQFHPVEGTGAVGNWIVQCTGDIELWARLICNVNEINGQSTQPYPSNDIAEKPQWYNRVMPYNPSNVSVWALQEQMSETPTVEGQSQSGLYYLKPTYPATLGIGNIYPICHSSWDEFSLWWLGSPVDVYFDENGRSPHTLKDAYPLYSVISALLRAINANITFGGDDTYSDFLYGDSNSIRGASFNVFITPKSNLIALDYDQAAQRGNITLKQIFEMLRDCFRCYWFVEGGKLRIEHIEYFRRGGNYINPAQIGIDLTGMIYSRTGKSVATDQQIYNYDKPETYERLTFGWMDNVTAPFDGSPIEIISPWVQEGKDESINISNFTSDLDYIFLNPNDISKDGFALICAEFVNNRWVVPFLDVYSGGKFTPDDPDDTPIEILQNGYLAFRWLERYYMYDLPAPNYKIDGRSGVALGTKRIKTQNVVFPAAYVPNLQKLVRTFVGDGQIRKLSINLSSLNNKVTLKYDP